ncbi:hypothetical protein ACFVXH_03255 [Kitasatospora sp. NPDC058184]|uniref:hypothetical protein n=1 Tax=Kitasatospora sp. NPDC058184 TaxID=3346370 RepID=UPI0036D88852
MTPDQQLTELNKTIAATFKAVEAEGVSVPGYNGQPCANQLLRQLPELLKASARLREETGSSAAPEFGTAEVFGP